MLRTINKIRKTDLILSLVLVLSRNRKDPLECVCKRLVVDGYS